jgi:hypothetical protein
MIFCCHGTENQIKQIIQIQNIDDLFINNPSIIIFSNIHLGGPNNRHIHYLKLLHALNEKIKNQTVSLLKMLIITGDFFDLLKHIFQEF